MGKNLLFTTGKPRAEIRPARVRSMVKQLGTPAKSNQRVVSRAAVCAARRQLCDGPQFGQTRQKLDSDKELESCSIVSMLTATTFVIEGEDPKFAFYLIDGLRPPLRSRLNQTLIK